ncbi:hypothetical protein PoB_003885100 [Plakobranchus ocellatus]|uniref:Uncharacterized protein n=1 Tax=Plakobranchus ocellatus TaxID=259542 RepID=A0AAV4B0K8_9GAST|nr:hypothetical protein PoB_003885100 [Plakobranchus ocellatus]
MSPAEHAVCVPAILTEYWFWTVRTPDLLDHACSLSTRGGQAVDGQQDNRGNQSGHNTNFTAGHLRPLVSSSVHSAAMTDSFYDFPRVDNLHSIILK